MIKRMRIPATIRRPLFFLPGGVITGAEATIGGGGVTGGGVVAAEGAGAALGVGMTGVTGGGVAPATGCVGGVCVLFSIGYGVAVTDGVIEAFSPINNPSSL